MKLSGIIQNGVGRGQFFTSVAWVTRQCENMLGYIPFPGTLNIKILDRDISKIELFFQGISMKLIPDDPSFCSALIKEVTLFGIPAAVILPSEDVRIHKNHIFEIISPHSIKDSFGLKDGDMVTILTKQNETKRKICHHVTPKR